MNTIDKQLQRFDDTDGKITFITFTKEGFVTEIHVFETSWWRKILFAIGINVYYKETEFKIGR